MWLATLMVLVALSLGVCFIVVQTQSLWAEMRATRWERAGRQAAGEFPKAIRSLGIVAVAYSMLGLAYYLGWQRSGVQGGVLTLIAVASVAVLVAVAFAIRSAWKSE